MSSNNNAIQTSKNKEYFYQNPRPDDYVALKNDDKEPIYNANIFSRAQVEEAQKVLGKEYLDDHGLVLSLLKHFGSKGYEHREENVSSLPGSYGSHEEAIDDFASQTFVEQDKPDIVPPIVEQPDVSRQGGLASGYSWGGRHFQDAQSAAANDDTFKD